MDIFKLFESTIASIEPGHHNNKHLRRDQLLDNYDEASKTLQTLIKAKENEIAYRRDLIVMLERSKTIYENKLKQANQAFDTARKHAPDSLNLRELTTKPKSDLDTTASSTSTSSSQSVFTNPTVSTPSLSTTSSQAQSSIKASDLDIPLPSESHENRSSLDRRLSEFLKTFPNLSQAGLPPASNNNNDIKPLPGYYTQQQQPPPPPISAAPPMMAMLRFPPPPLVPPTVPPPNLNPNSQENHDTADMDLSDYDESSVNGVGGSNAGIIPMVASAMQQGAGGKTHIGPEPYAAGQQFNNPIQYTHRLNPLPFDPSIMEPRLIRDSPSSSGSRDKSHSDKGGHRHSSSSGSSSSGVKHADKSKYSSSSSHSSSRSKRH